MKRTILLLFALLSLTVFSQKVENITFRQEGTKIVINYDLKGNDLFNVTCYYTLDGGKTYIPLKTTEGDVGKEIKSGSNKQIIWDVFKDTDGIKGEIQFKVDAHKLGLGQRYYINAAVQYGIGRESEFSGLGFSGTVGILGRKRLGIGLNLSTVSDMTFYYPNTTAFEEIRDGYFIDYLCISPVITYKLVNKNDYQLMALLESGYTVANWKNDNTETDSGNFSGLFKNYSFGLVNNFNHINLFLEYSKLKFNEFEMQTMENYDPEDGSFFNYLVFGIGYTF